MALLKDNGAHTFFLMIGTHMIPPFTLKCVWMVLSEVGALSLCGHRWQLSERPIGFIYPRAPTQPSRCISALTYGIHPQAHHTPFPSQALILTYHVILIQFYPLLHMASHWTSVTSQHTSFWLICFSHSAEQLFAALSIMLLVTVKLKETNSPTRQETLTSSQHWVQASGLVLTT